MAEWFYAINGEQYGPVSDRELHDLAGNGSLQPTDLVWREGFVDWVECSTVAGLFPGGASLAPPLPSSRLETTVPGDRARQGDAGLDNVELLDDHAASAAPQSFARARHVAQVRTPDDLKIPILISGIFNLVVGGVWAITCIGLLLTLPMWILAWYELSLFNKADKISTEQFAAETKQLSIYQIVLGIFNTPTLICGIILMIQAGRYEDPKGIPA